MTLPWRAMCAAYGCVFCVRVCVIVGDAHVLTEVGDRDFLTASIARNTVAPLTLRTLVMRYLCCVQTATTYTFPSFCCGNSVAHVFRSVNGELEELS